MNLVEQLHRKKNVAKSLLLSRKRKLSQLYWVSVLADRDPTNTPDQLYNKQLQSFQHANALERGQLFDESTLPPRHDITLQPRVNVTSSPSENPTEPSQNQHRPENTKKIPSPLSNGSTQSVANAKSPVSGSEPSNAGEVRGLTAPDKNLNHRTSSPNPFDLTNTARDVKTRLSPSPQPSRSVQQQSAKPRSAQSRPSSPTKSSRKNIAGDRSSNDPETTAKLAPSDGVPVNEKLDETMEDVPTSEQQSSPTSTTGAVSSNTPGPVGGSPNTSPGDDVVPPPLQLSRDPKPATEPDHGLPPEDGDRPGLPTCEQSPTSVAPGKTDQESAIPSQIGSIVDDTSLVPPQKLPNNRRPSMRINTSTEIDSYFKSRSNTEMMESPAPLTTTTTPRRTPVQTPSALDHGKRATRISSGALQKKSVSEILGETPKPASPTLETPISATVRNEFHLSASQSRQADRDRREKERSKLSTVVFAKPQRPSHETESLDVVAASNDSTDRTDLQKRDYLYTLFETKATSMNRQGSMSYLIQNAHKTLSTADHMVDYELQAICRTLRRLYQLQNNNLWPLRQHKRVDEVPRPTSHWDFLLDHAKWMRTDFREERKWKMAAAAEMAEWCAEYVAASPGVRKRLRVRAKPHQRRENAIQSSDVSMDEAEAFTSSHPTPDLIHSGDDDPMSDDLPEPKDIPLSVAPAAIFSLGASDFNFASERTPAFDKLLNELPLYEPATIEPDMSKSDLAERSDSRWKTDIVPVSRFAVEKLRVKEYNPSWKKSRYEYELEPSPLKRTTPLPPIEKNVALFMPENKHIRDRIHPGHSFRPPSEYPMPSQAFFESRLSSHWTHAEDDELRRLVKDYSYNWSLISNCLTPRSLYVSGADRRTPWECFERWIGLEELPADMSKTPYFKTYSGRIEAANRRVQAQIEAAQQRAGPNGPVPVAARKRTTQPVRVERKRNQRHLAMIDGMRKLAKKREQHLQKQQHQADLAAMRKANEASQPRPPIKTPAEFSALKYEREQKIVERQEHYRQTLIAHQRASQQSQRNPAGQPNPVPIPGPPHGAQVRGPLNAGPVPGMPNGNMPVPNGHRPHPSVMGLPNGTPLPAGMAIPKGMTPQQAQQMQANMARSMGHSPQQMRMISEAQKVQHEQMMRQAQQNGAHSSPTGPHATMANGKVNNPALVAAMDNTNGAPSPSPVPNGTAVSPRAQGVGMGQQLSSGHVPVLTQFMNQIRNAHPNLTDDEVTRHASVQLNRWSAQQATAAASGHQNRRGVNQAAVNAAMGAQNASNAAAAAAGQFGQNPAMMTNEQVQQYNNRMRMQQAQQNMARGAMQGPMQPGVMPMTNSPVMNMARPVSQHAQQAQMSRSATPREQRSASGSNGNVNVNVNSNGNNAAPGGQQASPRPGSQPMQT